MSEQVNASFLSPNDIMRLLPHRFPFLLVDRVDEIIRPESGIAGTKIRAIKNVSFNEPFFPGHFPHRPVMPGVLQIEAMAQVAALACVDTYPGAKQMDVAVVAVDGARFRQPVVPGDTLEIEAEVLKVRASMIFVKCSATVRGKNVAEVNITAKMFPLDLQ